MKRYETVEITNEAVVVRTGKATISVMFDGTRSENLVHVNRDEGGPTESIKRSAAPAVIDCRED